MEIRRDESEHYGGRKKGSGEDEASTIPWEDTTVVSVAGLRNFLQSLLGSTGAPIASESSPEDETDQTPPHHESHEPVNTYVSRATHAYQSTGKAVHDRNVGEPAPITTGPSAVTLGTDFGEEDLRRIGEYIDRLADLERRGIPEITLRRTLAFLDAIGQGIDDALPL